MNVTKASIDEAAERLKGVVSETPLQYSNRLSNRYHAHIYLKREDLQEVRSFKIRGAYNKISSLTASEQKRGVVCASAGNHAQGVAYSCNALEVYGVIFMPTTTPNQKIDKVRNFGGKYVEIKLEGETFDDANIAAQEYCKKEKAIYVHPFNDPYTISGQGTVAKEILSQLNTQAPDYVIACIGGGGLISGVATFLKEINKSCQIIGCEPEDAAGMYISLEKGKVTTLDHISTFVDGAAVKTVGNLTFEIVREKVAKDIKISEGQDCTTMIELYQNEGIVAEPAGALSIAALEKLQSEIKGKTVVCILSGGNNDILRYPEIMEKSLVYQGLKHYFIINFAQKPGQLKRFLNEALGAKDDIVRFEYIKKNNKETGPALVGIQLAQKENIDLLLANMTSVGIAYEVVKPGDMLYNYLI